MLPQKDSPSPPPHAPHPLMLRAWCVVRYIVVSLSLLLCSKIEFTQFPSLLNFYLKHALKWSHANNSQKFRPALNFFIRVDWSFYKNFDNVIYSEIKTSKLTLFYVACGMVGSLIKRTIEHYIVLNNKQYNTHIIWIMWLSPMYDIYDVTFGPTLVHVLFI